MRRSLSFYHIQRHFTDVAAEIIVPSPGQLIKAAFNHVRVHVAHAQAEQIAFQQRLQAIGIARLSRMSPREVIQQFGCD